MMITSIRDFAAPGCTVTMATLEGEETEMTVPQLLPGAFTADHMDRT